MDGNSKNTEDDSGYGAYAVGVLSFSAIYKINEVIGYLLGVEVVWGNLLNEVMVCSYVEARGIYYSTVMGSRPGIGLGY